MVDSSRLLPYGRPSTRDNRPSGNLMAIDRKPKFVTFDMNGTLIHFRINHAIRRGLGDRLPAQIADDFLRACSAYRIDECMGEYKPFHQIVGHSLERTMGP